LKTISSYEDLLVINKNSLDNRHFIIASFITYVEKNKLSQNPNSDDAEDNKLICSTIIRNVDVNELINNYNVQANYTISKYLCQSAIYTKLEINIDNILDGIIKKIFLVNNKQTNEKLNKAENIKFFKDYFEMYWKYLAYNKNLDFNDIQQIFLNQIVKLINDNYKLDTTLIKDYFAIILTVIEEVNNYIIITLYRILMYSLISFLIISTQ